LLIRPAKRVGRPHRDLGAAGEAELGEDVLNVGLRRAFGDVQLGRDLPVR
jgi:hypothetical protein